MRRIVCLFLLICIMNGCASAAKKTGYLQNYDNLSRGKYLENYWSDNSRIKEHKYSKIQVEEINIDSISDQETVTVDECAKWLLSSLKNATHSLSKNFVFQPTSRISDVKLEIAITEMTPGSAFGRMFAGELGMGHAWVQVEGRVVDIKSGEVVAIFSDRRRASGAIGFADVGGDSGPGLVAGMLDNIGNDIVKELKESFNF